MFIVKFHVFDKFLVSVIALAFNAHNWCVRSDIHSVSKSLCSLVSGNLLNALAQLYAKFVLVNFVDRMIFNVGICDKAAVFFREIYLCIAVTTPSSI